MKLEELINRYYDNFTPNDLLVISCLLSHKEFIMEASSKETAEVCNVSRATLLRVLKKMGLQNYAELKYLAKYQGGEYRRQEHGDIEEIVGSYHGLIEELKKADYKKICGLIYEAEKIYIYGTGNEQKAVAEEFKRIFLNFGKCTIDLFDYGETEFAMKAFGPRDLFFIISMSGETPEGIKILSLIEHTGIKKISLTRWKNNTIARMCGQNLYAGTKLLNSCQNMSYEIMAAFYILLDVLCVHYLVYEKERKGETGAAFESEL